MKPMTNEYKWYNNYFYLLVAEKAFLWFSKIYDPTWTLWMNKSARKVAVLFYFYALVPRPKLLFDMLYICQCMVD